MLNHQFIVPLRSVLRLAAVLLGLINNLSISNEGAAIAQILGIIQAVKSALAAPCTNVYIERSINNISLASPHPTSADGRILIFTLRNNVRNSTQLLFHSQARILAWVSSFQPPYHNDPQMQEIRNMRG